MAADAGGGPETVQSGDGGSRRVLRRRLYYVAGFDPASPKKYHRLYKDQSALQGALTGARYQVGELSQIDEVTSGWTVVAEHPDGARVEVDYRFLHWFEGVREAWPKDEPALFAGFAWALVDYYRSGVMAACRARAPAAWMASLSPSLFSGGFLLAFAVAVGLLGWGGAAVASAFGAPWILGAAPALLLFLLLMPAWKRFDAILPVGWLGRGMIGVVRAAHGRAPQFAERAGQFAERLAEGAREEGFDEMLVVSHSMGAQQACRALGRALMRDPDFGKGRPLRLLTLGSLLPFYSVSARRTGADRGYREEMAALVAADWIEWVDVTGPSDPGCAASLHPLEGLDLGEPEGRPHRRSPRYSEILTPEGFERLKKAPLAYHFQYIMATERAAEYDFFRLTAGPDPISAIATPPTP
jgi:hypothetical protein